MAKVLVTGMSGTGKSASLQLLGQRGHRVLDTDTAQWSRWTSLPDGSADWVWREEAMAGLLAGHRQGHLFVAGCKTNQGRFYPQFDVIALLSAPAPILLARIAARSGNPYGKRPGERALILQHLAEVEPLLRATATIEIDASAPLSQVVQQLEALASGPPGLRPGPGRAPLRGARAGCMPQAGISGPEKELSHVRPACSISQ